MNYLSNNPNFVISEDSFESAFNKIFKYKDNKPINNELSLDEENSRLFYIQNKIDVIKEGIKEEIKEDKNKNIKPTPFKAIKEKETNELLGKKTKRGRKKKADKKDNCAKNSKKTHGREECFNMLYKIKIHSINSIISITNCLLKFFNHNEKEKFCKINPDFKKKVNTKEFKDFIFLKLSYILTQPISCKYNNPSDYNKKLYNKIKSNPNYKCIINFLDEKYLTFFQEIYYNNKRTINLLKYGIDINITLSDEVELNDDKIKTFNGKEYINSYKRCINDNLFNGKLKFLLEK